MYCLYINIFLLPDILVQPISKHVNSLVVLYSSSYFQERERERERDRERKRERETYRLLVLSTRVFQLKVYSIIMLWVFHTLAIQRRLTHGNNVNDATETCSQRAVSVEKQKLSPSWQLN